MKHIILLFLFVPFFVGARAQFTLTNTSTISIADLRVDPDPWPLALQRVIKSSDTVYILSFRDKQFPNSVNMSTLKFGNLEQLRYFQKALSALKSSSNGEQADFKNFSIKRTDIRGPKKMEVKYVLTCTDGDLTDIQQPEADKLVAAIKAL